MPISFPIIAIPILVILFVLTIVRLYTTYRYRSSLSIPSSSATKTSPAPPIPYTIPFLGHTIAFLASRPGEFWAQLFRSHPRATGACTLLLGFKHTHILFSPSVVQALFKARGLARDGFNMQLTELVLGVEHNEALRFFGIGEGPDHTGMTPVQQQERINHNYLLEKKSVDELTSRFTRVLREQLSAQKLDNKSEGDHATEDKVERLYTWVQAQILQASTTMFMGSRILELCPNLLADYLDFERHALAMFFRIPKFLNPAAYRAREKMLKNLTQWHLQMQKECDDGNPVDPDGDIDWEPVYGSRANRARQRYYASRGLNLNTRVRIDLLYLLGLNSNSIPAACWMLMHILNPQDDPSLYKRVMDELASAERADGSLDIPTLVTLPLLQSIFHETLRLYVDVLVTRELKEDLTLPLVDDDDESRTRNILLHKNSVLIAPTWPVHRDESLWAHPPTSQFHPERFLTQDPAAGGKQIFTASGTAGKFFPFGGGRTICPGRVFAKQEVLAAVATVLLGFEFEALGFVDEGGRETGVFPRVRKSFSGGGTMGTDEDLR
ncbi:MAG: hypothetical protein Q9191_004117, partial [Dirinaria sp. TL-2023a]